LDLIHKHDSHLDDVFREFSCEAILEALRDETMNDPRELIEIAHSHLFFQPWLLGQKP
jgi:glycerol-3-phosphate dehydrogenase (NAD+)